MTKRRLITIGSMILATGVVGGLLMRFAPDDFAYTPRTMTNQDPAFAVMRFGITEGTNHSARIGNPLMGRINMMLLRSGRTPLTRARPPCFVTTTQDTSVLWVSLKHSNALPFSAALLARPDGVTEEVIWSKTGVSDPVSSGSLTAWVLPSQATNYQGWWFHLVTVPEGKRFASFEL